jgi:hypothetical protein
LTAQVNNLEAERAINAAVACTSLTSLDMADNQISGDAMISLLKSFFIHPTPALRVLRLDGNALGDDGLLALSMALKANTSISHLHLARNRIGEQARNTSLYILTRMFIIMSYS